jgi:mono/diheme cytochrome c family protein
MSIKKIIKYLLILLIAGITALLCYVSFALPDVGDPEDIRVEASPERIERGRYLANSVASCMDCHSQRDWSRFAGPVVEGTLGQGGEEFSQKLGFPGKFFAKNITPYALKDWTDGEILRAISSGVNKKGEALFPVMPHPNYGHLDREDLYSIIAYLRTLDPIENSVPVSKPDFPMNFIINTIPQNAQFSKIPDTLDKVAYGAYLFTAASCNDCHTKKENGAPVIGLELAGGFEFPMPYGGIVRSANITPDQETGIGSWTEEEFVTRFKIYSDSTYISPEMKMGEFNTVMPWTMFTTMKTGDLEAIYAYLRTVKPINHKVETFSSQSVR